jgi:sterol desaturase/sphingolipid hydroxylase (fatty acid hydroxylase superfamily)
VDVNFAVHLPLLDAVFGTFDLPGARWPTAYGIHGNPVPEGHWAQLALPFRRS